MSVHVGIIGAGNISETHARAARAIPGVEIAAVFGANRAKAERLAATYGGRPYVDLEDCLRHRPMTLVAIGSPSGLHAEQGIAAAREGLHVIVEKPIDITTERADALIAAADKADVRLGVFFQDRLKPELARVKQLVDSGKLGKPLLVSARVKWYRPPDYYGASRWRGTWALDGGGALMNQGIHTVDLLLWLLGPVKQVQAITRTLHHAIEVEDTALALLDFESGAVGTLEATTAAYPGYSRRVELTGTRGTVVVEHDRIVAMDLVDPVPLDRGPVTDENPSASSPVVSDTRGHQRLIEDFLDAIASGRDACCSGRAARASVELVEAIYASSRSGATVAVRR